MKKFIEILFPKDLEPEDLEFLRDPTPDVPGLARLGAIAIGETQPEAPNSAPLNSWMGVRIGFVAEEGLIEWPYDWCYWMEEAL